MVFPRLGLVGAVLIIGVLLANGCAASQTHQVSAGESLRLSVIERGYEIARYEGMSGDPERIYVARMPVAELEERLQEEEIEVAARLQARPVAEVRRAWQEAGIKSLPFPILEQETEVWIVDMRGGIHVTPRYDLTVPDLDSPEATPEPFVYDNIQIILGKWGHLVGTRSIVDPATSPPWGEQVMLDQMYDEAYMIDVPIQSLPTPEPVEAPLPTPTPVESLETSTAGIQSDASTRRYSVIDRAIEVARLNGLSGTPHEIYIAHLPIIELEEWLRTQEIETAARLEGRTEAEIRQAWDQAGIRSLPSPLLEQGGEVWVIDLRGGLEFRPIPLPEEEQRPMYDSVIVFLRAWDDVLNIQGRPVSAAPPPLGAAVTPAHASDPQYMVEETTLPSSTPDLNAPMPTPTPAVPTSQPAMP